MGIWTKKTLAELKATAEGQKEGKTLKRTLTPFDLVMLGIGAIIGAGLFSITGIAAAEHAGPAITIAFIISAIGCAFAGLCYSEISSIIPVSGSAYTYAYATMGELIAWMIGWDLVLEYAIGAATVSISWSAYIIALLENWGIYLPSQWIASPWQPVTFQDGRVEYGWINLPALVVVCLLSLLLIKGMQQAAWVNTLIVMTKISVVIIFIGVGVAYVNFDNYSPFIPQNTGTFGEFGWSGIMRAAGIVFFAYIGFDAVSTTAQEAIEPQRSIPIGILGSLSICTILYVLFSFVMTGLVPFRQLDVAAPVALAIDQTPFWWLNGLVKVAILAGLTSVILVMLMGQSRIFYIMSTDGLLPKIFSDLHPKFHTPWKSNGVLMIFVGLCGAFAPLSLVGSLSSIGTLLAFAIVCAGTLVLRYKHPEYPRPFKAPGFPFVPLAGILVCLLLMLSLGIDNWIRLVVWLILGLFVYITYGRHHAERVKV